MRIHCKLLTEKHSKKQHNYIYRKLSGEVADKCSAFSGYIHKRRPSFTTNRMYTTNRILSLTACNQHMKFVGFISFFSVKAPEDHVYSDSNHAHVSLPICLSFFFPRTTGCHLQASSGL